MRELIQMLECAGITVTRRRLRTLDAYVRRMRRAHLWGTGIAALVGIVHLEPGLPRNGWAWVVLGYLAGHAAAEVITLPLRTLRPHGSSGSVQRPALLPRRALPVPWLVLLPCLAAPLLLVGKHPRGDTRWHDSTGFAIVNADWFDVRTAWQCALLAIVALLLWGGLLFRLRRRQPPVEPSDVEVEMFTRRASARLGAATATSVGLLLLSGLAVDAYDSLESQDCARLGHCHYLYPLHAWADPLETVGQVLFVAGLLAFLLGRHWALPTWRRTRPYAAPVPAGGR